MQAITLPLQTVGSLKYENICSVSCKQDKAVLGETGFYYLKKIKFFSLKCKNGLLCR